MPIVHLHILAGRPAEAKARVIDRVTNAICETLSVAPSQVRVLIHEIPPEHWGIAGASAAERAANRSGGEAPDRSGGETRHG